MYCADEIFILKARTLLLEITTDEFDDFEFDNY